MNHVNEMFFGRAKNALEEEGLSAIEFLATNPHVSMTELAKRLNRGASALGLAMVIYDEAVRMGIVRQTAKDLLIRRINEKFADGWSRVGAVHPLVKIGFWEDEIREYAGNAEFAGYAKAIIDDLTLKNPPPEGWKPEDENDPLLANVFGRYWPEGVR